MAKKRTVLSLFCGCGGLDLGFVQAGFVICAAFDNWAPAVETHKLNGPLLGNGDVFKKSLRLADKEVCLDDLPPCEIILGGPPCQGFSFAGRQFHDDPRNSLYCDFVEIVNYLQPRVFLMENVRGMEAMALEQVKADFSAAGYRVSVTIARAVDFGLAQRRERLIIVGFRQDLKMEFEPPGATFGNLFGAQGMKGILEVIGDLPRPVEVLGSKTSLEHLPPFLQSHAYRPLPPAVLEFVKHIPNGGCFRDAPRSTLPKRLRKILDNPARYRTPRLFPKPDPSQPAQTIPADTNPSLGGVLAPDLEYKNGYATVVDPLLHTKNGIYTTPVPSRRLTPREAARLQGFPDEFCFSGTLSTQFHLIGNAVPVPLARAFAESIADQLLQLDRRPKPPAVAKPCRTTP